jgi:putative PIN family toxin of toxin-antitoxin system
MTLVSEATIEELRIVLGRAKFARYLEQGSVEPFLLQVREVAQLISNPPSIVACRDPKDDMFLEVAVHGRADLIVTGDRDLLDLNTFLGIRILTSAQYLELN